MKNTPRRVKFWASAEQSQYIKTRPVHRSQKLIRENPEDGSCVFRIDVVINYEMYSVFMSYGPGVKIIYPRYAMCYMKEKLPCLGVQEIGTTDRNAMIVPMANLAWFMIVCCIEAMFWSS